MAAPHGFACLIITQAGVSKLLTASHAASGQRCCCKKVLYPGSGHSRQEVPEQRVFSIESGCLMRIFAVAHILDFNPLTSQRFREAGTCGNVRALHACQIVRDHGVVVSGMNEHFLSQFQSGFRSYMADFFDFFDNFSVVSGETITATLS